MNYALKTYSCYITITMVFRMTIRRIFSQKKMVVPLNESGIFNLCAIWIYIIIVASSWLAWWRRRYVRYVQKMWYEVDEASFSTRCFCCIGCTSNFHLFTKTTQTEANGQNVGFIVHCFCCLRAQCGRAVSDETVQKFYLDKIFELYFVWKEYVFV